MNSFLKSVFIFLSFGLYKEEYDALNEDLIEKTYNFRTFVGDRIKIKSRDRIVTLSGRVASKYEKDLASRTATSVSSVYGVKNKLVIASPVSRLSDDVLAKNCKKRLAVVAAVSMRSVSITARKGRITLEGIVADLAAKRLIELRLKEIEGVESIENLTRPRVDGQEVATVRDQIDDISITGLIKLAVLQDSMTKSLSLSIATSNGNVAIHGEAVILRQIQKVSEIALMFVGVRTVSNEMTIRREASL